MGRRAGHSSGCASNRCLETPFLPQSAAATDTACTACRMLPSLPHAKQLSLTLVSKPCKGRDCVDRHDGIPNVGNSFTLAGTDCNGKDYILTLQERGSELQPAAEK